MFTQYYPVLRGARVKMAKSHETHDATCKECRAGLMRFPGAPIKAIGPGGDSGGVPTSSDDLFKWLQAGKYKSWSKESAIHTSIGPHDDVLTYINSSLEDSLKGEPAAHPAGAAAVKELYKEGKQYGWAVSVKIQPDSARGQGWYWYEVVSMTDGSKLMGAGLGVPLCWGCHSPGKDFVLSKYPLE